MLRTAARTIRRSPPAVPPWLSHPFRWQHAPVPWAAVVRGALAAGPMLALGTATGHTGVGVLAGLGAMLAGVNDRPGTRRTGIAHIGLPALAGMAGLLAGSLLESAVPTAWWTLPLLFAAAMVGGTVSITGPVWSAAGMQLIVTTTVGAGMPLPGEPPLKALSFLAGAGWLLLLRLVLRTPRRYRHTGVLDGERAAVAGVFDALADALEAVGAPGAEAARRRLTGALDRADEALRLHRMFRLRRGTDHEVLLAEQFASATALCEASVALLWEGRPLPQRTVAGPRQLAAAVRSGERPGPLPAPASDSPARSSFDRALLSAAVAFGRTTPAATDDAVGPHTARSARSTARYRRGLFGPAGRAYGLRVAVCVTASAVVALLLRTDHWFWLPATAAYLVKPDLGPLFSRTVNRFAGTALGVLVFAGLATLASLPGLPGGAWWPVPVAAGALLPVAARHYGFQTTVITVLVLSFVWTAGDTQAAAHRLTHTAIACGIVLLVGHLPQLVAPGVHVEHRFSHALRRTEDYVRQVLTAAQDPRTSGERRALRRASYRALGEARRIAEQAAYEFPSRRGQSRDWLAVLATAERVVDAATACAVRLEHGAPRPASQDVEAITAALAAAADGFDGGSSRSSRPLEDQVLKHVLSRLHRIGTLTSAA